MFLYLLSRLVLKDGKTDIGDTLVTESSSRMVAYLHFLLVFPFEPWVLYILKINNMEKVIKFDEDYGTYVDLIATNKKPEIEFVSVEKRNSDDDFIVPFDDKRSIRRIILTEDILNW